MRISPGSELILKQMFFWLLGRYMMKCGSLSTETERKERGVISRPIPVLEDTSAAQLLVVWWWLASDHLPVNIQRYPPLCSLPTGIFWPASIHLLVFLTLWNHLALPVHSANPSPLARILFTESGNR